MTRETMKRRRETADTVRKIEAHKMATRKPCETALKQQGHKAFACDFKRADKNKYGHSGIHSKQVQHQKANSGR